MDDQFSGSNNSRRHERKKSLKEEKLSAREASYRK